MIPIFLALTFIVLLLIVVVAGQPDEFTVTRSATIAAPPERIFPHVNDLHAWKTWSPWAKKDPDTKTVFAGPPSGPGASMKWEGNFKVGVGRMSITESRPGQLIRLRLDFEKPMKATNTAEFVFGSADAQTVVTWRMVGTNNIFGKLFGLFVNCEKMVGGDFANGLAAMKLLAEAAPEPSPAALNKGPN